MFRMSSCFLEIRLHKEDGNLNSMRLDSVSHVCVTLEVNQYMASMMGDKQMFMLGSWMS